MRTLSREFYIPKHYDTKVVPKGILAEIFLIDDFSSKRSPKPLYIAMMFGGKRSKPDHHIVYRDAARRAEAVNNYINNLVEREADRTKRRAKTNAFEHTLKVDDILYSSWGYDQTNIDFYQVTKLVGKKSVILSKISGAIDHHDGCQSNMVVASKDSFQDREQNMLKRVQEGNCIRIESYAHASPWDGTPLRETDAYSGH